ncbi:MAG: hypothetical protein JWL87_404 [Candidatus Adlerbacteria bacterium]|nr:hypothetical protein [Candidatus Adlerbacteria bacterium]
MSQGGGGVPFEKQPWYKKIFLMWTHSAAHHISEKWLYEWKFEPLVVIPAAFIVFIIIVASVDPEAISATLAMAVALSPVWLPVFLAVFFWITWMHYIRYAFWFSRKTVLLEIQLPPEVQKSPLAMELFFNGIHNAGGEGTFLARIWEGKFRAIFSLEIASNEGQIKFYIHCPVGWKNVLEAKLYGQYPEARIIEVEDYAARIPFSNEEYGLWATEFNKTANHAVPIKSYIDYGLDKNQDKPETTVDPMTNMLEYMGQIGQGEYIWLQIIMKARKNEEWYGFYKGGNAWADLATKATKEITAGAIKRAQELVEDDAEKKKVGARGAMLLSPGERLKVEAIERGQTKNVYECGIRGMYLGKKDNYNGVNVGNLVTIFGAFKQVGYNSIMPGRGLDWFDFPWQDWRNIRQNRMRLAQFFRYRHRAYFYVPYDQVPVYMTTEELATIWHFPSSVVQTPALDRVPSRRSDAPLNLPT